MASCTLLLLLASFSGALASHFYHGSMTFTPKERHPDGSLTLVIRYKETLDSCHWWNSWYCFKGNCGSQSSIEIGEVDSGSNGASSTGGRWCQSEAVMIRNIRNDKPFEMRKSSCCWIFNVASTSQPWSLLTHVDLGIRSDTGKPNTSPVTTVIPFIRVPENCPRTFSLLAHDPDNDQVRCRYGTRILNECSICRQHFNFRLDPNSCTLFHEPIFSYQNTYVLEIVLEDFPMQLITQSYTDGTLSVRSPFQMYRDKRSYNFYSSGRTATEAATTTISPTTTPLHTTTEAATTTISPTTTPLHITTEAATTTISPTTTPIHITTEAATTTEVPTTIAPTTTISPTTTPLHITTEAATTTEVPTTTAPTTTQILPMMPMMPRPLSKIPLHFAIKVDPPVSSCAEGEFLPRFLSPTPRNGEFLNAFVGRELEIRLSATARQSRVNDFIISGPLHITKNNTIRAAAGESVLRWTPTENDRGDPVPICFIAESQYGSSIFHSEMRCIIVNVSNRTIPAINVVCTENTMTVEVEKASVPGLHEDDLQLVDASCTPISNGTHLIATVSLNSCGTTVTSEEDPDNLIFKNQIIPCDEIGAVITRKHHVEINFTCSYPVKGRVALEFKAKKGINVFTEKGFGKFTYQIEFYQSNLFRSILDPESYPVEVQLKEMLYIEIKATSSLSNTVLFVESCKATPVDDPNYHIYYEIIKNGCILDKTVKNYTSSPQEFRFGIEAFKFIGEHEEVYMSCVVILCAAEDPNTRCSQGCLNATPTTPAVHHHHRRAAPTETVRHYISQGPLRLKKTTDVSVSSTGLSMNLVFIAAVLLVTVIIVCGAVIYTAKRSKVKYQPLPSSDF